LPNVMVGNIYSYQCFLRLRISCKNWPSFLPEKLSRVISLHDMCHVEERSGSSGGYHMSPCV